MKSFSTIDKKVAMVVLSTVHDLFEDFDLPPNILLEKTTRLVDFMVKLFDLGCEETEDFFDERLNKDILRTIDLTSGDREEDSDAH